MYANSKTFCSGDLDSAVPITDTRCAIKMLGLSVKKPWRPWYLNNEVK